MKFSLHAKKIWFLMIAQIVPDSNLLETAVRIFETLPQYKRLPLPVHRRSCAAELFPGFSQRNSLVEQGVATPCSR